MNELTVVPAVMRRVVVTSGGVELIEAPTPVPTPREVLIRSVVVGICGSDTHAAHGRHPFVSPPYHIQDSQLRVQGSATYLPEDYRAAIDLLIRGVVRAADFVTAVHPLSEAAAAFRDSAGGRHIKVLVALDPALVDG